MKLFGKELTFNGNKVYHVGNKPTVNEIGAATSNHNHDSTYIKTSAINDGAISRTTLWSADYIANTYLDYTSTAAKATKLATARKINGVAFDGTKDITISTTIPSTITGLKELRFSEGAVLAQSSGFAGLTISANPLKLNVSEFIISSPHFNLTSAGALSSKSFNSSSIVTNALECYGNATVTSNLRVDNSITSGGGITTKGAIYGVNNIALANGSLYCGTIGNMMTCDYLRFNENILAGDNNKKIHLIDTAGNGASVYAGSVWANSGSWSDMSLKENIRRVANSEEKTANLDIINENQKTLDTSYDVTRPEMFDFIKDKLLLYLFNYKQLNENDEYEKSSFDNKIGFIANEISEDRVGKTFVGEQDGKLAYSLNNYVFLLTGALQEEIKRRELLEEKVSKLEKIIKQEKDGDF
jgi:hypothetical protein|nr:MAG TPA: Receptor recognition protein, Long tail, Helical sandwich, Tail fiber [Ackermannviridae sp.]